jgi:DNA-binding CsgD family transcriptional regulator
VTATIGTLAGKSTDPVCPPRIERNRQSARPPVKRTPFDTTLLGLNSEALAQCERFLAIKLEPSLRAALLFMASRCSVLKDPPLSLRLASELLSLGRSLGDEGVQAGGLVRLARIQLDANADEALDVATEGARLARETGQRLTEVLGLHAKGLALITLGRPAEALVVGEEILRASENCYWPYGRRLARAILAEASVCAGRLEQALDEADNLVSAYEPGLIGAGEVNRADALAARGEEAATEVIERAVSRVSASGDTYYVAAWERHRGRILISQGHEDDGYQVLEAAIAKFESFELFAGCAESRALLAEVAINRGDLRGARRHLDASSWRLPRPVDPAGAPVFRAEARLARSEGLRAHNMACNGLAAAFEGGHVLWVVDLLELVAITCSDLRSPAEAARLLGTAESQRDLTGYVRPAPAREELAPVLADLQAALGHVAFEAALSEGGALSLEEAVAYARRGRGSHSRARSGWESLPPSEQQVASLVGQHLTNAQIAERLFISVPTVKSHLNRAFAKLGVDNRGQLAAGAHQIEAPRAP